MNIPDDDCLEVRYVLHNWQVTRAGSVYADEEDKKNALRLARIFARSEKVGIRVYDQYDSVIMQSLVS